MADNEIRNPAKAYFKWKMPVITKSEDDWNFWNTEDKYNRTMFIGYNDTTTPHVASLFIIVDGKPMQAVGDDVVARIAGLETNTAQALADIQELIDRVNAQQLEISNLQQECQRILAQAADTVLDARTWAEGTDEEVADLGGEHSAKGWAQKANDIVAAGLPSDATFDHLTVTGSSKFGQDPDRANQPGLEIEGTGEIQAYRTVNMMNGATVSYDETVEMPWSDSSNKVPNTAWVQQAVQHGTIDPNTELTVKKISTSTGGAFLNASHTAANGNKHQAYLSVHNATSDTDDNYIEAAAYSSADSITSSLHLHTLFTRLQTPTLYFDGGNKSAGTEAIRLGQASGQAYQTTRYLYCEYPGRFVNGLQVGFINDADADGIPFKILRSDNTTIGKWMAAFGVTPTVPDIADAADSSNKVPNTKWVQAAIAAGGGGTGGAVSSVNGKTGAVVLSGQDIKTDPSAANTIYQDWAELSSQISGKQSAIVQDSALSLNSITLANSSTGTVGTLKLTSQDGAIEFRPSGTYLGGIIGRSGEGMLIMGNDLHIGYQFSSPTGILVSRTDSKTTHNFASEFTSTVSCSATIAASDNSQQLATTQWVNAAIAAAGGGGSGAVTSVNGKTGEVVLSASDVGAASSGDLANYVTTDAMNTELTNYSTTAAIDAKLADYQHKLIAGDGIAISESNVISVTGGTGGAVSSVNGKTGEVVLNATDVGAITGAEADTKITTALEPYAKTADVTTTLEPYAKSADVTTEIANAVAPLATTEALTTGLAGKQDKLTAGTGIAISDTNVISATVSSPVDSVNGKTGAVVLSGEDIRLHPTVGDYTYPAVSDVIDSISNYLPDGVSGDNKLVDNSSLLTQLATYQPKLTAGEGITISAENVISATGGSGGGAVTSVNGNTGAVVLTGDNIMTASDSTTSLNSALAGKQASITAETDLTVGSLTAGSADSGLYAGRYSIRFTYNSTDKLFVDATGPYVSNLTGGDLGPATGAFNWYINTTTDYNKFNVFNRYHVTDEATHEVTTYDSSVLSIGGSPDNHSTWIDFTANYLSFKGDANFGETGMNHNMNFNGPSSFNNETNFHGSTHVFGNVTYWKVDAEGGTTPWASYDKSTGKFDIGYLTSSDGGNGENRVTIMADSREANYGATFNLPVTVSDASFKRTSTLAADDNSTEVPTTAWVTAAIAAGGGGGVPDDITCKTLKVTDTVTVHKLTAGDGYEGTMFTCNTDAWLNYDTRIGWTSGRLRCARTDDDFMFDFNHSASAGQRIRFNDTVTILSAMPASTDSSTTVPTTAWVQSAIAASSGGVPDDITCKTLKVTNWDSGLDSIEFAGNLKYSGDYGNGSLGIITAREFYANASGYYSTRVSTSGIILNYGSGGNTWFNADSSTRTLTIDGTLKSSTPDAGSNNTDVATTAWVNTAITNKANINADNFSQAGRSYLSGLGMPSNRYIDLTLGASDSTYTAPANGYLFLAKTATAVGQYIALSKATYKEGQTAGVSSETLRRGIQLLKGESVTVAYSAAGSTDYFRFIYAEGESNV